MSARRAMREAERELRRTTLDDLPSPAEMARAPLTPLPGGEPAAGSRPCLLLEDERGRRYLFKAAETAHIAAEELSYALRSLRRRPHVPVAVVTRELPGGPVVPGLLQPLIEHSGERLPTDTRQWSPLQREVMLAEHPWEWLLANLDTHIDQYVLVGPRAYPLNIDWDHTLVDLDVTELTRFTRRLPTTAPVRNLLYDDYVHGRVGLDFAGLWREVRSAQSLGNHELVPLLRRYAEALSLAPPATAELIAKVLHRRDRLHRTFEALLRGLRSERVDHLRPTGAHRRSPLLRARTRLQESWQRFLVLVMHDRVQGPFLRFYRRFLALGLRAPHRPPEAANPPGPGPGNV